MRKTPAFGASRAMRLPLKAGKMLHDMPDLMSLSVLSTGQRVIPWSRCQICSRLAGHSYSLEDKTCVLFWCRKALS